MQIKYINNFSDIFKQKIKDGFVFKKIGTDDFMFQCPCGNGGYVKADKQWKIIQEYPLSIQGSFIVSHGDQEKENRCHFHIINGNIKWEKK